MTDLSREQREALRERVDHARRVAVTTEFKRKWGHVELEPERSGTCEYGGGEFVGYFCGAACRPGERFCGAHGGLRFAGWYKKAAPRG